MLWAVRWFEGNEENIGMPYQKTARTEARTAATRAKIVKAARELFLSQGFENTSMQQIVVVAGTSIGNCYFYFPNKDALFEAVAEDIIQEIDTEMDAIVAQLEGPNRYGMLLYAACAFRTMVAAKIRAAGAR